MIYFIRRGSDGPVKIGFTNSLERRLAALQNGNAEPLTVIRTMDGDMETERVLHGYFADMRLHGEWFEYSDEMMNVEAPATSGQMPAPPPDATLAQQIAGALHADFGRLKAMNRTIAEIAGCSEDTVTGWVSGRSCPATHCFLNLGQVSPSIRAIFLRAMGKSDDEIEKIEIQREAIALLRRWAR